MTDLDIIDNIKKGEKNAFTALVDKHQALVLNTCRGFLHNEDDALDVAQEVFVEVYRSIKKFRGESEISTWLYRIAVNKSLNFIRDNKKHRLLNNIDIMYNKDEKSVGGMSNPELPDAELEKRERSDVLHKAIDELPKKQKTAFVLSKYENLSYKEISDVMNKSVSSVESLIFRAKKNLQEKLINFYKENT